MIKIFELFIPTVVTNLIFLNFSFHYLHLGVKVVSQYLQSESFQFSQVEPCVLYRKPHRFPLREIIVKWKYYAYKYFTASIYS